MIEKTCDCIEDALVFDFRPDAIREHIEYALDFVDEADEIEKLKTVLSLPDEDLEIAAHRLMKHADAFFDECSQIRDEIVDMAWRKKIGVL